MNQKSWVVNSNPEWNRGTNAFSQNPVAQTMVHSICTEQNTNKISESEKIEELTALNIQTTFTELYKNEQISALHIKPKHLITFKLYEMSVRMIHSTSNF